jgi:hypothetical protein
VLDRFSHVSFVRDEALLRLGLLSELKPGEDLYPFALLAQGKITEAWASRSFVPPEIMLAAGRPDLLTDNQAGVHEGGVNIFCVGLRRQGRLDEAMARGDITSLLFGDRFDEALAQCTDLDGLRWVWAYRSLTSYIQKDRAEYERARKEYDQIPYNWRAANSWFGKYFALPFLSWLDGDEDALSASARYLCAHAKEVHAQVVWYMARLLIREIDEQEFDAQPVQFLLAARRALTLALRAELEGIPSLALEHYRRYQALPDEVRSVDEHSDDPLIERFVSWRVCVLT